MSELLIGCGAKRDKRFNPEQPWRSLITLDNNSAHNPDVIWDLERLPYPFKNEQFAEIHAYEVLEHTGQQGDYKFFFAQFSEFWRILKPMGLLCATTPSWDNKWAWGDPSHKRIINEGSLIFLSQAEYGKQVGVTSMSDYRRIYKANFEMRMAEHREGSFMFMLQAIKPLNA